MPRSGALARDRLERAALELYTERGYDATTAADIAAIAGVTERTFFRHFPDKREVVFHIEKKMQDELTKAFTRIPSTVAPFAAVVRAFRSMAPVLEAHRGLAEARHRVITATPALQERELSKAAAIAAIVASYLEGRHLGDWSAHLLAQASTAALGHAVHTWIADSSNDIDVLIVRAFADLQQFFHDLDSASMLSIRPGAPTRT